MPRFSQVSPVSKTPRFDFTLRVEDDLAVRVVQNKESSVMYAKRSYLDRRVQRYITATA